MRLEHINMVVGDLEQSIKFYQAVFPHWRIRSKGERDWYGKPSRWIHLGDDQQYLAMSDHGEGNNRDLAGHSIGLAHIGFEVSNVDAVIQRLQSAGFDIAFEGADAQYRKNIYFIDPAGFEVEFIEYLSDIPAQRNLDD